MSALFLIPTGLFGLVGLEFDAREWVLPSPTNEYVTPILVLDPYQLVNGSFTWQQAKADAEARGGQLAVLNTPQKLETASLFLINLGTWPDLWIGATDEVTEGDWRWITGEAVTTTLWEHAFSVLCVRNDNGTL